jgi:hypothetical protein
MNSRLSFASATLIRSKLIKLASQCHRIFTIQSVGSGTGVLAVLLLAWWTMGIHTYRGPYGGLAQTWQFVLVFAVGMIIALPIILLRRERYVQLFKNHFGWIPVTFGALTYPYWLWYAGSIVDVGFFQTAAQVLPVILLATVIDVRQSSTLRSDQLALPIIAVFLGEIAALNETAFQHSAYSIGRVGADFAVVASSLVVSIVALIMAVLANLKQDEPEDDLIRSRKQGSARSQADKQVHTDADHLEHVEVDHPQHRTGSES